MVLTDEGLNVVRDLVYDDVQDGELGSGGSAVTASDTGLQTPDTDTILTLTKKPKTDKQLQFDYLLPSTGGNTATYREYTILNGDADNYDRVVFTGVAWVKNGTQDLNITKRYFFKSV